MAAIPIRLSPLPGEALDSWLETYAHLLHVTVRDIFAFAGVNRGRLAGEAERPHKLWLYRMDEPDLIALSAVTTVPAATLAGMTLARYEGTGAGRGDRRTRPTADTALVAAADRVPLLPALPGRQRRPVDAGLAHPLDLRLHQLPGAARRHLPRLRQAASAHPLRPALPPRPLRPHRPAAAAMAPAARRHRHLHQQPRGLPAA